MAKSGQTLQDVGEQTILRAIARRLGRKTSGVLVGVGDDGAVLSALGPKAVVVTDTIVEGLDFTEKTFSGRDVGHKAAAVNLSDLAAMGAKPRGMTLSIAAPGRSQVKRLLQVVDGAARLGQQLGAPLVGGDLSGTRGPMVVTVTAFGQVKQPMLRHRGRPGDCIMVTGPLGLAAAGLRLLRAGVEAPRALVQRQRRPQPRVALGEKLGKYARSAADISDGLAQDVTHVLSSGCGARIDARALPLSPLFKRTCQARRWDPVALALGGGEDFELVLAVPKRQVETILRLAPKSAVVGKIEAKSGLRITGTAKLPKSFQHFRTT